MAQVTIKGSNFATDTRGFYAPCTQHANIDVTGVVGTTFQASVRIDQSLGRDAVTGEPIYYLTVKNLDATASDPSPKTRSAGKDRRAGRKPTMG
jgi:hypothetical protein